MPVAVFVRKGHSGRELVVFCIMQSLPFEVALLIDADNVSALPEKRISLVLAKLEQLGVVSLRRAYGHWGKPCLRGWSEVLHKYAISPIQQFDYSAGKNATDIALTIDAMDLLHSGKYQGFCIVSCDSDFTPLAVRLRSQGLKVYGFGEYGKTAVSFREACTDFNYLERAIQLEVETAPSSLKITEQLQSSVTADKSISNGLNGQTKTTLEQSNSNEPQTKKDSSTNKDGQKPQAEQIEAIFREAVAKNLKAGGWAEAVAVGTYLSRHQKRKADYNASTWATYYKKFPRTFEVKTNNGQTLIRIRPA